MQTEHLPGQANAAAFDAEADDVFGRIASRYDLLSDLFSLGLHRRWKRRVAELIAREPWVNLLDVATGTGDVVLRVARHQALKAHQLIIASDISLQMLTIAHRRATACAARLEFRPLDAHAMPSIPDACIDLYSISLGLKICERRQVLREAWRVLRPGGRLVALEASHIRWAWLHRLYLGYMRLCMPVIGRVATGGDASACHYLLKGIQYFPGAEALAAELSSAGFDDVSFERLSLGIVAIHTARKPRATAGRM